MTEAELFRSLIEQGFEAVNKRLDDTNARLDDLRDAQKDRHDENTNSFHQVEADIRRLSVEVSDLRAEARGQGQQIRTLYRMIDGKPLRPSHAGAVAGGGVSALAFETGDGETVTRGRLKWAALLLGLGFSLAIAFMKLLGKL